MEDKDLFSAGLEADLSENAPLAARMRPQRLDDVVGQKHLLAEGSALRVAVETGTVGSMVFFGPPGTGKTTVARLIAKETGMVYEELSAVSSGVSEVRRVIERARHKRAESGRRTLLFIDEIHRFSKGQQDALLHAVEDGIVILVGASTENPYFEVIPALISRCELFEFRPLPSSDIRTLLDRALLRSACPQSGGREGRSKVSGRVRDTPRVDAPVLDIIAEAALGDARRAFTILERSLVLARSAGKEHVNEAVVEAAAQRKLVLYDKGGDAHYDVISAFIKSLRGSDPDAALYYLAVMLTGGEDPKFIARRMVIFASEDVGNADPQALEVAVAVARAVEFVGLPEGRISLAQGVTYLSCAPKSNASYGGIEAALHEVEEHGAEYPPAFLRSTGYSGARTLGHGVGYEYPHANGGYIAQRYLPDSIQDKQFYHPTGNGQEARIREFLDTMRALRREGNRDDEG